MKFTWLFFTWLTVSFLYKYIVDKSSTLSESNKLIQLKIHLQIVREKNYKIKIKIHTYKANFPEENTKLL